MESVKFDGCNIIMGKDQEEYKPIHANIENKPEEGFQVITACFELTEEEIAEIVKTKRIWYQQYKLPVMGMAPMNLITHNPLI